MTTDRMTNMIDKDEIRTNYACFRCGEVNGPIKATEVDTEFQPQYLCGSCGDYGLVSFEQALDLLNELYLNSEDDLAAQIESRTGYFYD